jgi:hypothetical protein
VLVLLLALLLIWMLRQMPKKAGIHLYGWWFLMLVIGFVLIGAVFRLAGLSFMTG